MDTSSDLYWRIKNANDDMNLGFSKSTTQSNSSSSASNASLSPPPGFSASSTTSSSLHSNNFNNNSTNSQKDSVANGFDSMSHAKLSPSALDPNGFSSNFILPRFAKGGPMNNGVGNSFGFDLAIAEPEA